jgi:hypothetical protein
VDETKLKDVVDVIFDFLRTEEASHPLLVAAVEHYRSLCSNNAGTILATLKQKGLA